MFELYDLFMTAYVVPGLMIAVAMIIVVVAIAGWGPRTLDRELEEIS